MKKQIWKYPIKDPNDIIIIEMPEGAEVLSFQMQKDTPCIWALVDPTQTFKTERHFRLAGTGHDIEDEGNLKFIGTIQMKHDVMGQLPTGGYVAFSGSVLVFHLFEKI